MKANKIIALNLQDHTNKIADSGVEANNWMQLFIIPSIFPSYSLFNIEVLFDILFSISKSGALIFIILYSECPNVKYSLFSFYFKPLFLIPLPPPMLIVDLRIKSNSKAFTEAWSVRY